MSESHITYTTFLNWRPGASEENPRMVRIRTLRLRYYTRNVYNIYEHIHTQLLCHSHDVYACVTGHMF